MIEVHLGNVVVVVAVLLFFGLGVAMMVIMDHKAKLPGGFTENPFSVAGMRRDHPVIAFLTTIILLGIIAALVLSIIAAFGGQLGLFKKKAEPKLLARLSEERTAERLRHFHNLPAQDFTAAGKKNVCFYCHGDYPHSKEVMVRTLLNMHTQFVGCMTCHNDDRRVNEAQLSFKWMNYSGVAVKGPPYGTDIDAKTGYLVSTDDYFSKIVVSLKADGEDRLLEVTSDAPEAREFVAIAGKLSDHDREAVKKTFHKLVREKGRACARCHVEEARSYLPFRKLGFSERRVSDLTSLNIVGVVQKYRDFHMPNLMRSDTGRHPAAPAPAPKQAPAGDLGKDPRSWWRQQYDAPKPDKK